MNFINPIKRKYLRNLDDYECTMVDNSIVRNYITSPIQNQMTKLLPKSLAPNVITLLGLITISLGTAISLIFSPHFESMSVPSFVFLLNGISLVVYRFLDDIDGKQARRTGSSSPMGELVDHGCDALTGTIGQIQFLVLAATGPTYYSYILLVIVEVQYIFENWVEYYTGKMEFGYINSINEGVYFASFFLIMGVFVGQDFYHKTITDFFGIDFFPFNVINVWEIAAIFAAATSMFTIANSFYKMRSYGIIKTSPGILPPVLCLVLFGIWVFFAPGMFESFTIFFMICFTLMFAFEISNMTLAFVLKMPLRIVSLPQISLFVCIVLQFIPQIGKTYHTIAFFLLVAQSVVVYGWFIFIVSYTICNYLDINFFTIKKKTVVSNTAPEEKEVEEES